MTPDTLDITVTIPETFRTFSELFAGFTHATAQMHSSLAVHDDATRALFNSLSRIAAYSDQVQLILSLMQEDIRVVDELTSARENAPWTTEVEHFFYEWLRFSRTAAPKLN